jgi:vanillate monooxygenase ferredoxin subunit
MADELLNVIVRARRPAADDITAYELVAADDSALPAFTAGAHVDVHLPNGLVRQYSLANAPGSDHYLLGVLREAEGRGGSACMADQVQAGASLRISAPRNNFPLTEDAPHSLLLAGGIGVTPMFAMAHRLQALARPFALHYCTRSPARTAFREQITATFGPAVQFHFDDGAPAQQLDLAAVIAAAPAGTHLYVCGPAGFMEAVLKAAADWLAERVHTEYFSADPGLASADDGSFIVRLASTGAEYTVGAQESIIDALARHGIDVPVSCEQGICGTCLTGVLEGTPDHRDAFLTDDERAANNEMTVCCSRALSPLLVLDL